MWNLYVITLCFLCLLNVLTKECVWEKKRERVREKERARVCVCVCVRAREREREGERERECACVRASACEACARIFDRVLASKREEITRCFSKLLNEKLHGLHSSPNNCMIIKSSSRKVQTRHEYDVLETPTARLNADGRQVARVWGCGFLRTRFHKILGTSWPAQFHKKTSVPYINYVTGGSNRAISRSVWLSPFVRLQIRMTS
jgi:hypothetical protein